MSFRPAGAEDSNSDDDGFYMGSIHDNNMNGGFANNTDSRKNFVAMPAGAESDDEDSDGFEFSSAPVNSQKSTPRSFTGTQTANDDRQYLFAKNEVTSNSLSESGVGRGRGLLPQRGRGRGGFPKPPPSFNNKGKTSRRFLYCYIFPSKKFPSVCVTPRTPPPSLARKRSMPLPWKFFWVWAPHPSEKLFQFMFIFSFKNLDI